LSSNGHGGASRYREYFESPSGFRCGRASQTGGVSDGSGHGGSRFSRMNDTLWMGTAHHRRVAPRAGGARSSCSIATRGRSRSRSRRRGMRLAGRRVDTGSAARARPSAALRLTKVREHGTDRSEDLWLRREGRAHSDPNRRGALAGREYARGARAQLGFREIVQDRLGRPATARGSEIGASRGCAHFANADLRCPGRRRSVRRGARCDVGRALDIGSEPIRDWSSRRRASPRGRAEQECKIEVAEVTARGQRPVARCGIGREGRPRRAEGCRRYRPRIA